MPDLADLYPGFAAHWIDTSAGRIFARTGGEGPPLLLLHGYPQTNVIWHKVAPRLGATLQPRHPRPARLRLVGGAARRPRSCALHQAGDGARDDRPDGSSSALRDLRSPAMTAAGASAIGSRSIIPAVSRGSPSLDIVPTYTMWHGMDRALAYKVWHWTFLALPAPFPETLIGKDPVYYLDWKIASWTKAKDLSAFDPRALAHYRAFFQDPLRIHATCEDYRAGRTTDLALDEADRAAGSNDRLSAARAVGRSRHSERERPARDLARMGE